MTKYVAFLRGINVGGHIVKKDQLQRAFILLGFQNVTAYKQSGNIIFDTDVSKTEEVEAKIAVELRSILGYDIAVFVRTLSQLRAFVELDPFKGQEKEGDSFLVTMLQNTVEPPLTLPIIIPKSTAQVISARGREIFSVTHGGGEGAMPNPFIESKLTVKATTRNLNIIREILEKFGNPE